MHTSPRTLRRLCGSTSCTFYKQTPIQPSVNLGIVLANLNPASLGAMCALPSPETFAAYVTPAPGDIRHNRTTCGLKEI